MISENRLSKFCSETICLFFFYVRIVKGPKTNIFTCKLCAWVIFIILFTRLLCDNSNSLTYEPRKGAKSNTFTCQLCDCTSHADWLFTIIIVTWTNEDLFRLVTNALKKALVFWEAIAFKIWRNKLLELKIVSQMLINVTLSTLTLHET